MSRLENDKYYTPIPIANYCWDTVLNIIGNDNITEIIEPSCGDGAFYHYNRKPNIGYDIKPECKYIGVKTCDYLAEKLEYKKGRLILGNPPYGRCLNVAQKFYKKSVLIADYIGFVLPISQLNNNNSMYEFDLIHSEDLGIQYYTDRWLHCCFNIYKRPLDNKLNKREVSKLKDITIYRQDCRGYEDKEFDIRMCYWGNGTAGKILKDDEHYAGEYKIQIHNKKLEKEIHDILTSFDWQNYLKCIAMRRIKQYHIVDVLKKNITNIK